MDTGASPARRRWTALLLFAFYAIAAATVLGANPFSGETITPFDRLVKQRAWSFVDPGVEVRQNERSDILNSRIPQWETAKRQIRDGRLPKWNDKVAGGGTFLTVNSNLFTPAFLVFAATPDSALGFYLAMLANLAIAGLGMHLFLRRYLSLPAAVLGALTFEFCGFIAAWLYWPHVFTIIWAPWLLWAVDRCARKPGLARALPVGIATMLACLGGFPFVSVLVLETGALYALILALAPQAADRRWRFPLWYAAGTAIGLLLAALPLMGLVFWLQQFDLGYRDGRGSYLTLGHVRQLFPPWAYEARRVEQTMYVGIAMFALAMVPFAAVATRRLKVAPLHVLGASLLVVAAGLVFGLWPMWLVGWLPGMAFNSWSRAIGLLDIALVILGSAGFDVLWKRRQQGGRGWMHPAMGLVAACQVVEIALFFRSFNGPVDGRYYFPETPSIEYMRANAGPFDYVITDRSFGMSGTLGAYGLREWLAHYFRSPALQRALHEMADKPFHSSVASPSMFEASGIKFDSPAMAAYNVRYAAIDSRSRAGTESIVAAAATANHVALPPMPGASYRQAFDAPRAGGTELAAISIRLATYHARGLPGSVALALVDDAGVVLRESRIDAAGIEDNAFARFALDRPLSIGGGRHYAFQLRYEPGAGPQPKLTAWSFPAAAQDARLTIDGTPHAGTVEYRLHFEKPPSGRHFRRVYEGRGTAILENVDSPRGPYFLAAPDATPDASSGRQVEVVRYAPDHFVLRYAGREAGYVVVPMNAGPDWVASVDGHPRRFLLKDGVMPAVPVQGEAAIEFSYQPKVLRYLAPWQLATAGFLLVLVVLDRVTRKRGPPSTNA
jgi:hypothetical protein